jgi:hypothetical protein
VGRGECKKDDAQAKPQARDRYTANRRTDTHDQHSPTDGKRFDGSDIVGK